MNTLAKKIAVILISTAFTGVASTYIFQAIFSVPLLKSIVAIASTITIVILEIILILWLFHYVRYKQGMYARDLGRLAPGIRLPGLAAGRSQRSLLRTVSASPYVQEGNSGFGLLAMVTGILICSALFVASDHVRSIPWFVLGGISFGQEEALSLAANALALLLASYFGPWVALGIGLGCLSVNYLDSINVFYHAGLSLPWLAYPEYTSTVFSWPDYAGLTVRCVVAGLVFPHSQRHLRMAGWLIFFVILLVNAGIVYLHIGTYGLSQSEVAQSLLQLTLSRLVDLCIVLVAHLIIS